MNKEDGEYDMLCVKLKSNPPVSSVGRLLYMDRWIHLL